MFRNSKFQSSSGFSGIILQNRGLLMYAILAVALAGFEMFNFSTTQYALGDLLGTLSFAGIQWATILAIAFCGIDFAGIGRLFMPEDSRDPTRETWYLFGAWLLAATMNALLTWWGVSMALVGHQLQSTAIIDRKLVIQLVPIFVAAMVWVTRVLLIGSFAMAGRHAHPAQDRVYNQRPQSSYRPTSQPAAHLPAQPAPSFGRPSSLPSLSQRPAPLPVSSPQPEPARIKTPAPLEPEYIPDGDLSPSSSAIPALRPLAMSARPPASGTSERRF